MSVGHYENFPVASVLCPPALRPPIQAIYAFARTADDIADEGDATAEARLADLARYRAALQALERGGDGSGGPWPQVFRPLARQMREHQLPARELHALLNAFEQDVPNPHYETRDALLQYCSRSAHPVGRLLLHLYGIGDAASLARSDAICAALQLINFWQDLSVDLPRGRCYLPLADAQRHGVDPARLAEQGDSTASQALVRDLVGWARALMWQGAPLALQLPGRVGWELRLVVCGGLRVTELIAKLQYRTVQRRPRLHAGDGPRLAWRAWQLPGLLRTATPPPPEPTPPTTCE